MNYQDAESKLTGRYKNSRKLENNTYLERRDGGLLAVRLYSTDVVTFHPNGDITLNTGGWHTLTTKARMNGLIGDWGVSLQSNGQWFITRRNPDYEKLDKGWEYYQKHPEDTRPSYWLEVCLYAAGIVLHPDGTVTGRAPIAQYRENLKLRKKVQRFAADYVRALHAGKVPAPSAGDCWGCLMVAKDADGKRQSLLGGTDHIMSHISEKYYVPSLLVRALEEMPSSVAMKDTVARVWRGDDEKDMPFAGDFIFRQIQKNVSRYCLREIGQAS